MGPYCLQYMLPRNIINRVELSTNVETGLELDERRLSYLTTLRMAGLERFLAIISAVSAECAEISC